MHPVRLAAALGCVLGLATQVAAQTAAAGTAASPRATASVAAPAAAPVPAEAHGYNYDPAGRRDPFVSLLRRGADAQHSSVTSRAAGLAGLGIGEVTVKGTVASREGFVAIVQGVDSKTYIVRSGDKLLDGTVKTVTANGMVILQQVNDPLSSRKQREVRKVLRQTEEAQ